MGLGKIAVSVSVELEGEPLLTTAATMTVSCETLDGSDPQRIIDKAKMSCMATNSLQRGFPVTVQSSA